MFIIPIDFCIWPAGSMFCPLAHRQRLGWEYQPSTTQVWRIDKNMHWPFFLDWRHLKNKSQSLNTIISECIKSGVCKIGSPSKLEWYLFLILGHLNKAWHVWFFYTCSVLREHRHLGSDEREWTRLRSDFLEVGEGRWKKIVSESGDSC